MALHTRANLVPAVLERARAEHPYDVPCVLALPIEQANPDYLAWVLDSDPRTGLSGPSCQRGANHYDTITPTRGAFGSQRLRGDPMPRIAPRPHPGCWACSALPLSSPYPLTQVAQASAERDVRERRCTTTPTSSGPSTTASRSRARKCLDKFAERQAAKMANERRMYHQQLGPILKACKLSMVGRERRLRLPQRQGRGQRLDEVARSQGQHPQHEVPADRRRGLPGQGRPLVRRAGVRPLGRELGSRAGARMRARRSVRVRDDVVGHATGASDAGAQIQLRNHIRDSQLR